MAFAAPRTLAEALAELDGDGALALAGGTSLALLLRSRLIQPAKLVSLAGVAELSGIDQTGDAELRIGAMTTLRECRMSPAVRAQAPLLAHVAGLVGNPRVRAVATVGGALAHSDPRQDLPPVLLALGARVALAGPRGARETPLDGFFRGLMETGLAEGELVTQVIVPVPPGRRAAYRRFAPGSEDDFPTVSVAASLRLDGGGAVAEAAIALGGAGAHALLAGEAAALLRGRRPSPADLDAAAEAAAAAGAPTSDQRGSAAYKRAMVRVNTRRVLADCLGAA